MTARPTPILSEVKNPQGSGPSLLYLYGIFPAGSPAQSALQRGEVPGVEPDLPLFPVALGSLVAAVSRVPAAEFEEGPLNDLMRDLPRLTPYVVRHEEAVRALLALVPALVPAAFGRLYRDEQSLLAFLRDEESQLRSVLSAVEGKQEWGLKVIKDSARLWDAAETASPRLTALAREEAEAAPGRAYLLRRQRERAHAVEAGRVAAEALDQILDRISRSALQVIVEEIPPHNPGDVEIALKAALLVDEASFAGLEDLIRDLNDRYSTLGLTLELNGPWAPYSFIRTSHPVPEGAGEGS